MRFAEDGVVGGTDGAGLGRFDDDGAVEAADARAALVDWGVVVGADADFLVDAERALVCC